MLCLRFGRTRRGRANERKHGVSFEEAQSVFADDLGLLIYDLTTPGGTAKSFAKARLQLTAHRLPLPQRWRNHRIISAEVTAMSACPQ